MNHSSRVSLCQTRLAAWHPQAALRDDVTHHLVGAASKLVQREAAIEFFHTSLDRRQRVLALQQSIWSHDVLGGDRDALIEFGKPDLEDRGLGIGNLLVLEHP